MSVNGKSDKMAAKQQPRALHRRCRNGFLALFLCLSLVIGLLPLMPEAAAHAGAIIAQGYCGDLDVNDGKDVTWKLDDTGTLTISGVGAMRNWNYTGNQEWNTYIDKITNVVIEVGVTSIGKAAFILCDGLQNLTIPDSVTSIGEAAFYRCSSLTTMDIPNSVTNIGEYVFFECSNLTTVSIPNSVTNIGEYVFYKCSSLTTVDIPNSVTSIGRHAFDGCSSLTTIDIPNGVTSIGNAAFNGCSSLTTIDIPNSVTSIGDSAFNACSSLTTIDIPDSVTSIGDEAFYWCNKLTLVIIKSVDITEFGNDVFDNTDSELRIYVPKEKFIDYKKVDSWKEYADKMRSYDPNGYSVTLTGGLDATVSGGDLRQIGVGGAMTTVTFTANNNYRFEAFDDITSNGITATRTSDTVVTVSGTPTANASITVPNAVFAPSTSGTVGGCTWSLSDDRKTLTIAKAADGNGDMGDFNFDYTLLTIDAPWMYAHSDIKSIIIGDAVTRIGDFAFFDCENTESVAFGKDIKSIGKYAFRGLSEITIPGNVELIDEGAFSYTNLSKVTISEGVKTISDAAFCCCWLSEVVIPNTVKVIGEQAFAYCDELTSLTIYGKDAIIDESAFEDCINLSKVTIKEGVKEIETEAFKGCTSLEAVDIEVGEKGITIWALAFPDETALILSAKAPETGLKKLETSFGQLDVDATTGKITLSVDWDPNQDDLDEYESAVLSLEDVTPVITVADVKYTGSAVEPAVTVKDGDYTLIQGTDYTVAYSDNTNAGNGTVTITGKGLYVGTASKTFSIGKADTVAPTGLTAMKGDTLADVTLPANWAWADSTASVGAAGTKTFKANYTSPDTNHNNMTNVDITVTVNARPTSGTIGGCTWSLSDDLKTLTIAKAADGDGDMGDSYLYPWEYAKDTITKVILCDGVKTIRGGAFSYYGALENIIIPDSVEYIEGGAVSECLSLKSVTIPGDVLIGQAAFIDCTSLKEVTILGSVEIIGTGAFAGCSSLEKVTILEGVETIAMCAFEDCTNLSSVTIGVKNSLMIDGAFGNCNSLDSVTFVVSAPETGFKKLVVSEGELAATTNGMFTMSDLDSHVEMSVEDAELTVTLADSSFTWTGSSIEPAITVKDGEQILTVGTDYTVEYSNNVNAGTGKVTVKGTGMYVGSASKEFSIEKIEAPNKPDSVINVGFTTGKVSDISLPTGWTWAESDKTKTLDIGTSVTATAEYTGSNKENYNNTSVNVSILRSSCTHSSLVKTDAVAATCTTGGNSAYWTCQDCGAYFSDENGTNVISANSWIIDKLGHDYGTPSYVWSDDYSSCTATVICVRSGCAETADGHKITETVETTSRVVKGATVDAMGTTEYTASFKNTSYFAKQMKEVDDIEKLTPGTTEPETPGTTDPETPGTTDPETPGTTEPETPGTTEPETPGTTEPETPGTTDPETPGTTEPETPGTTEPETPGTTEPETPGTTEPTTPEPTTPEPSNPTPSGNGNSGSGNTNNTTNTNNQNTSNNTNNTTNTNNQNTGKTSTETEKLPDPVVAENKDGSTTTTSVSKDIFGTPVTKKETTFKDGTKVTEETSVNAYGTEKVKEKITEKDGSVIETSTTKYADNTSTVAKTVTNPDNSSVNYNALISANGTQTFTEEKKAADGSSSRTTGTVNVSGSGSTNTVNKDASGAVIGTVDTKTYESGKSVIASTEGAGDSKVTNKVSVNLSGIAKLTSLIANSGTVNIPASIEANDKEYPISVLGKYLMMRNKNIINVTIGNNITTIGYKAFYRASNLSVIEMTASVQSISKYAFKRIAKDAKFIITASDEDFERLVNLIKESGVSKTVTFEQVKPKKAKK